MGRATRSRRERLSRIAGGGRHLYDALEFETESARAMFDPCRVRLDLDKDGARIVPGEEVRGRLRVKAMRACRIYEMRLEFRWRVNEKSVPGAETTTTSPFRVLVEDKWEAGHEEDHAFSVSAPRGPFSYRGELFDVVWEAAAVVEVDLGVNAEDRHAIELVPGPVEDAVDLGPAPPVGVPGGDRFTLFGRTASSLSDTHRVMSLVWLPFMVFGGAFAVLALRLGLQADSSIDRFNGTVGVLIGLGLLAIGYYWGPARRLGQWSLAARPERVSRGQEVRYKVQVRPSRAVRVRRLRVSLTLQEWVQMYNITGGRRRPTHWRVEDILKLEDLSVEDDTFRRGEDHTWEGVVRVPSSAPCSFGGRDHRLVWSIMAEADRVNRPDWTEAVFVVVRP